MYCPNCRNEVDKKAHICVKCGFKLENSNNNDNNITIDKTNMGLNIVSFLWPLVGLI